MAVVDENPGTVRHRKWRDNNRERHREYQRGYRERNKDVLNAWAREWSKSDDQKDRKRDRALKKLYGLTLDQKRQMIADQDFMCATCVTEIDDSGHVDHCHKTGKVRGILCRPCNKAIGFARDDPEVLRSLADYLERKG